MKVQTGIDIVEVQRFKKMIEGGEESVLARLFLPSELEQRSAEHLAGIFAAKEAVAKALGIGGGLWLDIEITNDDSGKPHATIPSDSKVALHSCDISISHDGGFAIAQCVALRE